MPVPCHATPCCGVESCTYVPHGAWCVAVVGCGSTWACVWLRAFRVYARALALRMYICGACAGRAIAPGPISSAAAPARSWSRAPASSRFHVPAHPGINCISHVRLQVPAAGAAPLQGRMQQAAARKRNKGNTTCKCCRRRRSSSSSVKAESRSAPPLAPLGRVGDSSSPRSRSRCAPVLAAGNPSRNLLYVASRSVKPP
jgi:hypothetical protein